MENNEQTQPTTTKKNSKTIWIIASLIVLLAAGAAGYRLLWYSGTEMTAALQMGSMSAGAEGTAVKAKAAQQEVQTGIETAQAEAARKAKEEAEAEEEAKKTGTGKKVALDPGHQGWNVDMSDSEPNAPGSGERKAKCTSGTQGNYSGLAEHQLTLDISKQLREELESRGYEVLLTREDNNTAISNAERARLSNDWRADIFVRVHANSVDDSSVNGALMLTSTTNNPYVGSYYSKSRALAEAILKSYCQTTGFANKGIQENDTMTGINWSTRPVVIIEMGFMSNRDDDMAMADSSFQELMVKGIADGIDTYFGNELEGVKRYAQSIDAK